MQLALLLNWQSNITNLMVIGTTGHEKDERRAIEQLTSSIPIVWAGNFSTGVNLLFFLTQQAAKVLDLNSGFDPESNRNAPSLEKRRS